MFPRLAIARLRGTPVIALLLLPGLAGCAGLPGTLGTDDGARFGLVGVMTEETHQRWKVHVTPMADNEASWGTFNYTGEPGVALRDQPMWGDKGERPACDDTMTHLHVEAYIPGKAMDPSEETFRVGCHDAPWWMLYVIDDAGYLFLREWDDDGDDGSPS